MKLLAFISFAATVLAGSRTTAPSGAIVVAKSGGDYSTISDAILALDKSTTSTQTIFIKEGTYEEQVFIPTLSGKLIIYGQTKDDTTYAFNTVTITNHLSSASFSEDGKSATVRNWAKGTNIYNVNVNNTYGAGHQALALSANNTQQGYYGCQFSGFQNTLFAQKGNQAYAKCYIEGALDFIFGRSGNAWFDSCEIGVLPYTGGTITAQGRLTGRYNEPGYFVMNKCSVDAAPGKDVAAGTYYLGRPWSQYAEVAFQESTLSNVINSAGWTVWASNDTRTKDVLLAEFHNSGPGSEGTRASFANSLYQLEQIQWILGEDYKDWVDTSYLA